MNEWISIEDRLPEIKGIFTNVSDLVLVFRPLAPESNDPVIQLAHYTGQGRESPQGIMHEFDCWCHVTHWMPIPNVTNEMMKLCES